MKKSMQTLGILAFLGCSAVLAIAAGGQQPHHHEKCKEEWKKTLEADKGKTGFLKPLCPKAVCSRTAAQDAMDMPYPARAFQLLL